MNEILKGIPDNDKDMMESDFDRSEENRTKFLAIILPLATLAALAKPTAETIESYHQFEKPDKSKLIEYTKVEQSDFEKMPKELRREIAKQNMAKDAENIYKGETVDKRLRKVRGKLVMLHDLNGRVDKNLFAYSKKILDQGKNLTGEARSQYISIITSQFEDVYAEAIKNNIPAENKEQITGCFIATLHDFNSLMKAGSEKDQLDIQSRAGLISKNAMESVKQQLETSKDDLTIGNLPKSMTINGKKFVIDQNDKFYQHIGKKLVELPMSAYGGTEIKNLYDLEKTDKDSYDKLVKENLPSLVDEAIAHAKLSGADVSANDEELRKNIETALLESTKKHEQGASISIEENKKEGIDLKNIGINGMDFKYQIKDYNLFKVGNQQFSIPGLEIAALFNGEKGINVSCDIQALGGRIDAKMLCEGNMVRVVIPNLKTAVHEKHQKVAINGLALLALLPLLGIKFRSKKFERKPEGTFLDYITFPTLEPVAVTPDGVKLPLKQYEPYRKFPLPISDTRPKVIPLVGSQYALGNESSGGGGQLSMKKNKRSGGRSWSGQRNRQK